MNQMTDTKSLDELLDISDWDFEGEDQEWIYQGLGDPIKAKAELAILKKEIKALKVVADLIKQIGIIVQAFYPKVTN
jgi:hypothetical protein